MFFLWCLIIVCFLASPLWGSEQCFSYNDKYVCLVGANLRRVKNKNRCFDDGNLAGCSSIWQSRLSSEINGVLTSESLVSCLQSCYGDSRCLAVHFDQQGDCDLLLDPGHLTLNESSESGGLVLRTELDPQSMPCDQNCSELTLIDSIRESLCLVPFCEECSATDRCLACQPGFVLDSDFQCVVVCNVPNCMSCDLPSVCSLCHSGYALLDDGICSNVPCLVPNCRVCQSSSECQTCSEGFHVTDIGTCTSQRTNQP